MYYPRNIRSFIAGNEPVFDGYGGDKEEFIMLSLRLKTGLIFKEYETIRDEYFKNLGFTVKRFSNYDILKNFDGVCEEMYSFISNNI